MIWIFIFPNLEFKARADAKMKNLNIFHTRSLFAIIKHFKHFHYITLNISLYMYVPYIQTDGRTNERTNESKYYVHGLLRDENNYEKSMSYALSGWMFINHISYSHDEETMRVRHPTVSENRTDIQVAQWRDLLNCIQTRWNKSLIALQQQTMKEMFPTKLFCWMISEWLYWMHIAFNRNLKQNNPQGGEIKSKQTLRIANRHATHLHSWSFTIQTYTIEWNYRL